MLRKNSTIQNGWICVAGDDSSVRPSVKSSFQFHRHQSAQIQSGLRSAESKFPPWRSEASQIQFPACWCHRTAEWMSHRWFTWLITQTSLLPSCRILQEKVSRLARIKARLQCWSRPSLLCPRRALEKMPKVWRFKYLNSLAQARSLVHEKEGRTEENIGNVQAWSVCLHSIFNNVLHRLFPNWTWSHDGGTQGCWEQWFHVNLRPGAKH